MVKRKIDLKVNRAIKTLEKRGFEVDEEFGKFRIVKNGEVLNTRLTKSEVVKATNFFAKPVKVRRGKDKMAIKYKKPKQSKADMIEDLKWH